MAAYERLPSSVDIYNLPESFIPLQLKKASSKELALRQGNWVKLICGASNEDLPAIRDLCAVYAAAGVHCVDVGADTAVVTAAREGLNLVESRYGFRPWLMISVSDGKDIHFRKAFFNPQTCPQDCPKPCQKVCPAEAISSNEGVLSDRCYGCGRCLPVCPLGIINEKDMHLNQESLGEFLSKTQPDHRETIYLHEV